MDIDITKILERLASLPDQHVTFYDAEGRISRKSYSEVHLDVKDALDKLQGWEVKAGMRVGILASNCYEWVVFDVALIHLKCTCVAFPEEFASKPLAELAERYELNLLLISKQDDWPNLRPANWVAYMDADNPVSTRARGGMPQPVRGEVPLSLIFSSGTSGKIKCMIASQRGLENTVSSFTGLFDFNHNDSILVFLALTHYQQRMIAYAAFYYGFDLLLVKPSQVFTAFKDMKPTLCLAPPLLYESIHAQFKSAARNLSPLRRFKLHSYSASAKLIPVAPIRDWLLKQCYEEVYSSLGGRARILWTGMAPIKKATLDFFARIRLPLYEAYGLTESGVISSNTPRFNRRGSVGRPVGNIKLALADDGEIIVYQDHLMTQGYLHCDGEDETSTYISPSTVATGDIGRFDRDGYLYLIGRKKEIIITAQGTKVHPEALESQINECPQADRSVVFGSGLPYLVALISVCDAPDQALESEIHRHIEKVNATLPTELRIVKFVITAEEFTRENGFLTRNLKLNRRVLFEHFKNELIGEQAPPGSSKIAPPPEAPATEAQRELAVIWRDVLNQDSVSINDSFFDLGGNSIVAAQIIARVRNAFQIELPLRTLFDSPTIKGLAESIESLRETQRTLPQAIMPVARDADLPLSFAQQRLWFLDQLEPGSPVYNIPGGVRLSGRVDIEALGKALNEIVRRHETLRTSFKQKQGMPFQAITPDLKLIPDVINLRHLPPARREQEARRLALEEARQPFDLSQAPLLRAKLLKLDEDDSVLLVTFHHIVADGWSIGIFVKELATLYETFKAGGSSPLSELPIQYADYASWQLQWLQGEVLDQQLSYWKQQLGGVKPALHLPTDRPRAAVHSDRGAQRSVQLSRALTDALNQLSASRGATLFMTLTAAFKILLGRYTYQEEITIVTPIANRNLVEVENIIGFFLNMLVLRTSLTGEPTYLEALDRVMDVAVGAYSHQDLPFEKLVEELDFDRGAGRNPLFQVMFVLQNAPMPPLRLHGLTLRLLDVDSGTAKFDLTMSLSEVAEGISGFIEYSADLFDGPTVDRMIGNFRSLLEGIVANPRQPISRLPLMSEAERHQILVEWNQTKSEYDARRCAHHLIEEQARRTPHAVALVDEQEELNYEEMNRRSNRLAHRLQSLGVGPEVRVGIFMQRSVDMIVGLLAILKAGGAYIPLDPAYAKERLALVLEDGQPLAVLTQSEIADRLPEYAGTVLSLDGEAGSLARYSEAEVSSPVAPGNLAYVIYTPDSTGKPKGVMIEHKQLVNYISSILPGLAAEPCASFAIIQSLTFDSCSTMIYPSLATGGTLHLISRGRAIDGRALREYFRQYRIDYLKVTSSHLEALLDSPYPQEVLPEKCLVLESEMSRFDYVNWVQTLAPSCRILNHYGPAETTVGALTYQVGESEGDGRTGSSVPIGRPIGNTEAYLLDAHLQPVPVGIPAHLHIGGLGLARGYLNRPDLTAEKFIPNPFSAEPGSRLYKTGDLARRLPDGSIEFLGNINRQGNIPGLRVELEEVEATLASFPPVRDAAVMMHEDAHGDKRLVAYLVAGSGSAPAVEELRHYLKEKLPSYLVPSNFIMLDALPLTPGGKLDIRSLPVPDQACESIALPTNPIEETLAEIWCDMLGLKQVGIRSNFFELGGHSQQAIQIISRVCEVFQVDLPPQALFEGATIAELGERVEEGLINKLEGLSEEEAEQLLKEKF